MYILGLSFFYHESSAALIKDGAIVGAAAEERFSRIKHDSGFPTKAVEFVLEQAGISIDQVEHIVFYERPFNKFERLLTTILSTFPDSYTLFREGMLNTLTEKLWVKSVIRDALQVPRNKILFVPHHVSHASSAYYASPYQDSLVLTLDGVGEWSTGSWGIGKGNRLDLKQELRFPHSVGLLYSAFTSFLGFEVNDGEYKVMGMAPYGKPKYKDKVLKTIKINNDGSIKLDMSFFSFHHSTSKNVTSKFVDLFGKPRPRDMYFFTPGTPYPSYFGDKPENYQELAEQNQYYADIAASIQEVTEEILIKMLKFLAKKTGQKNLCLAGGVALNSVANGKILKERIFENVFVQPAAGDDGGALGAAYYLYYHVLGNTNRVPLQDAYLGKEYKDASIKEFLVKKKLKYQFFKDKSALAKWVAKELSEKKVIGLYQGRFEWGPRALGNRSIIADPRSEEMKDIVNTKIKFREPYRPFAPAVLEERAKTYFDTENLSNNLLDRYMLMVTQVKANKKKVIPAVTHVDGSARIQVVDKDSNPLYRGIIEEFEKITGVAVIMNTSFNLKGEPIVTTPSDAYNTFMKSGLDHLVLDQYVVSK